MLHEAGGIEIIGNVSGLEQAESYEHADVIVADWELPELAGGPEPPVVMLLGETQPGRRLDLLRSGVRGVLGGDAGPEQLAAAIQAAAAGLAVFDPQDSARWLGSPTPLADVEPLTPRETEVLAMMAEGLSNKLIAHRLGISEHTVKFHVTSIMSKLGAASRTEAVTIGLRSGLILL